MRITARLRCMAQSEIADMIGPRKIAEIQRTDPHPVFKAFVVGHEGEAKGYLVGVGNIVKHWFQAAIIKLHEAIQMGIKIFHGHGDTNDQAGRMAIGEVVGKKLMRIGDRVSTVVACHILPEYRHLPLDIASIEASIDLEEDRMHGLYVAGVGEVTAIALSNSAIETPGFAGATLLGQIQAFAKSKIKENRQMDKSTAEEIKQMIREAGLHPSDLFMAGEITADPVLKEQMREKNASPEIFYEMREMKRELAESGKRLAEAQKENSKLTERLTSQDAAIKASQVEGAKARVLPLFEKAKAERKLEDRQSKFIAARLARFVPVKPEEVEKEFNAFLDAEIDEERRIAKEVYGIAEKPAGNSKGGGKEGAEPTETPAGGDPQAAYLDPAKNEMIKLG
ncbi:MAG: hypothetical protein IMZ46_02290 [Acidobacteria bacterium]|nr:hypothetical protein [Acidobacteriota bacterium]